MKALHLHGQFSKLVKDSSIIRKPTKIHSRSRARRMKFAKMKGRHSDFSPDWSYAKIRNLCSNDFMWRSCKTFIQMPKFFKLFALVFTCLSLIQFVIYGSCGMVFPHLIFYCVYFVIVDCQHICFSSYCTA